MYYDVRYRRIPNVFVLLGLVGGLCLNIWQAGWLGLRESLLGCTLAFFLMFVVRMYSGALGPGDIKWFAAIGAIIGWQVVLPAFLIVLMTGMVLAFINVMRLGTFRLTMERVWMILYGMLPGQQIPRFPIPEDRQKALPYGVAICMGSLIALVRQLPQFS
ncbi:MAG: prepilin peptidase [Acidobacteria bacterium]|nr:prepilin peptidase [Acidobacteriota bacterium]